MKISFVIPVYKSYQFLERLIASLATDLNENILFEFIFIDDSPSEDFDWKTFKEVVFDNFFKSQDFILFVNSKNMGVTYSRNKGFLRSSGDYIVFIDSDDFFYTENLNIFFRSLIKYDTNEVSVILFSTQASSTKLYDASCASLKILINDYGKGERLLVLTRSKFKPFISFLRGHEFAGLVRYHAKSECKFYINNLIVRSYSSENVHSLSSGLNHRLSLIGKGHLIASNFLMANNYYIPSLRFFLKFLWVRVKFIYHDKLSN
jgi:glycosyltransferase involved in cell wall biosynthesis